MAQPVTSRSMEDYLEAILTLHQQLGYCRSVDLARHLGFTKASISAAVGNLAGRGYVRKLSGGNLLLTPDGRACAERVMGRHRLIALALTCLGVPSDVADADACLLKHDISDETFSRLLDWHDRRFGT